MSPPVIYVPPPLYTSATPAFGPVLIKAIRAGAIAMSEWVSLRFVDHAPASVWIITAVFALLILGVIECQSFLNFKGRRYFAASLVSLTALWVVAVVFAYVKFGVDPAVVNEPKAAFLAPVVQPSVQETPIQETLSRPRQPRFLTDLRIERTDDHAHPLQLAANTTVSVDKLRIFLEYSRNGAPKPDSGLIPIVELSGVARTTPIKLALLNRVVLNGGDRLFWGDPQKGHELIQESNPTLLLTNIVVLGPDNTEQNFRSAIWQLPPSIREPFVILSPDGDMEHLSAWLSQR